MNTTIKTSVLLLVLLTVSVVMIGCVSTTVESTEQHSITVKTLGGMPLDDVEVRIYSDREMSDLLWAGTTDEDGKIPEFTVTGAPTCVAKLGQLPEGYSVDEFIEMKPGETVIAVETNLLPAESLSSVKYSLGDIAHDFTVTAYDGTEYTLSQMLEDKEAVVLNFWFMNCDPCRMEFPYLQQAYLEYADKIEVLALNPLDGTNESVREYAQNLGLEFPMSACDADWVECMQLNAYPTTVVIDRYGMITMMHKGSITEKETFIRIFEHFTSKDYIQGTVRNLSEIE